MRISSVDNGASGYTVCSRSVHWRFGARASAPKGTEVTAVAIVKAGQENVYKAVREAAELAGGFDRLIRPDATVLIKPNVMRPLPPGSGIITDVRVTEAVTGLVRECGPRRVIIGEGASVGYDFPDIMDTHEAFALSGTAEVARKLDVELVDLNRDATKLVEVADADVMQRFRIARAALEADVIVNVPVLKTHVRTAITCSLKNMKGVLPGSEKRRTHMCGLDRAIVDLNRVVKPHFTIVDALTCMEGVWAGPEDKVRLDVIVAGADPVAVDATCARLMGLDPTSVKHIYRAGEVGLGVSDCARIELRGVPVQAVCREFRLFAETFREQFGGVTLIEKDACTGCMGEVQSTFIYLKAAAFDSALSRLAVVMGSVDEVPLLRHRPLVVGNCASRHRELGEFVPGCPPHGREITWKACELLEVDKGVVELAIRKLHERASG